MSGSGPYDRARGEAIRSLRACLSQSEPKAGGDTDIVFETTSHRGSWTLAALVAEGEAFWNHQSLPQQQSNDRPLVLLALSTSPASVGLYLAAIRAGLIPAFLAPLTEKQRAPDHWRTLGTLCLTTGAAVLCVDDRHLAAARQNIACPGLTIVSPGEFGCLRKSDTPTGEPFPAQASDIAFLQFTSGTTGLRKAVAITHGMLENQIESYATAIAASRADVMVSWLPLYHDMGLIACLMLPLMCGMRLVLLDPIEWVHRPGSLLAGIERHRGSLCFLPNFAFNHLALTVAAEDANDLSSMRAFINCSEPCAASAFERFLARFSSRGIGREQLLTCYAMAEAVFAVTQSAPDRATRSVRQTGMPSGEIGQPAVTTDILSSGAPIEGLALEIRDSDGRRLPDGEVGEIHVAGPCVFDGYRFADEAAGTGKRSNDVDEEGWFATGDLGFLHAGELFVIGRSKDVIIVNGRNFLAHEIEAIAGEVDGVKPGRAVAFGSWREAIGSEALVLLAEPKTADGGDAGDRELSRSLRQRVFERAGVHPTVRIVPPRTLIKTTSGKLSRIENKRQFEEGLR